MGLEEEVKNCASFYCPFNLEHYLTLLWHSSLQGEAANSLYLVGGILALVWCSEMGQTLG